MPSRHPPLANFTYAPERPRPGETVVFEDTSVSPDAPFVGIASRSWNFSDGTTGADIRIIHHAFANAGDYTVTLAVKDTTGLPGQTTRTIAVRSPGPPTADFTFTVSGDLVHFQDRSTDPDNNIVTWIWDFGDGVRHAESTLLGQPITRSAQHRYSSPRSYTVTLTVEDGDGSSNKKSQAIVVQSVAGELAIGPSSPVPPVSAQNPPVPQNTASPLLGPVLNPPGSEESVTGKTLDWVFKFAIAVFILIAIVALIVRLAGR